MMMKRSALVVMVMAAWAQAAVPAADTPRAVMDQVTHEVIAVLRDTKLTLEERRVKVTQVGYDHIDFDTLSRLSLGTYWKGLSEAKKAEFVAAFKEHAAKTYGHFADEYTDEDIVIVEDRTETSGDHTVMTKVVGTRDGQKTEVAKVDYRMRKKGDQWKVIDVTIDSVSLASNFRTQFQEIVANKGIDELIRLLKEKDAADGK